MEPDERPWNLSLRRNTKRGQTRFEVVGRLVEQPFPKGLKGKARPVENRSEWPQSARALTTKVAHALRSLRAPTRSTTGLPGRIHPRFLCGRFLG